jgi:hypothetical protein
MAALAHFLSPFSWLQMGTSRGGQIYSAWQNAVELVLGCIHKPHNAMFRR